MLSTARGLLILAGVLVGAAGYFTLRPAAGPDPPFSVDPVELDLGPVAPGSRGLMFTVANPADRPRRVIGLAEG